MLRSRQTTHALFGRDLVDLSPTDVAIVMTVVVMSAADAAEGEGQRDGDNLNTHAVCLLYYGPVGSGFTG